MATILLRFLFFIFLGLPLLSFAGILVTGKLTHELNLSANQTVDDSILISNDSDKPQMVKVTLADYSFNSQGQTQFLEKGALDRSNASWIQTNRMQFEVPAKSTYTFPFTIKVPNNKQLSGSYWSIFLVEPIVSSIKNPEEKDAIGIQTVIRYGVQVVANIGNKGIYELKILEKSLEEKEDKKIFALSVENCGTVLQSPKMAVEFVSKTNKFVKRIEGQQQRIYPDCSVKYNLDVSALPKGKYKAMVFLDHGEEALFGAKYDVEI